MVMNYKEKLEKRFEKIQKVADVHQKKVSFRHLLKSIRKMDNANEKTKLETSFSSYTDYRCFLEELRVKIYKELIEIN